MVLAIIKAETVFMVKANNTGKLCKTKDSFIKYGLPNARETMFTKGGGGGIAFV